MKHTFIKSLVLVLCVMIAVLPILSGCGNTNDVATKDSETVESTTHQVEETKEETQPQTKEETQKPTQSETKAPTEPQTEKPYVHKPMNMTGFRHYTIEDVISIYGENYFVSDTLYGGGLGFFYYKDGSCPYTFYFYSDAYSMGTIPSVKAEIAAISAKDNYCYITTELRTDMNGIQAENACSGGEWYIDEMNSGGYVYTHDNGAFRINCYWNTTDTSRPMNYAEVFFN